MTRLLDGLEDASVNGRKICLSYQTRYTKSGLTDNLRSLIGPIWLKPLPGQTHHNVICLQAEKLELALAERSREVHNLRLELQDRRHKHRKMRAGQHWFSEEGMSVSMGSLAVSACTQLMRLKYSLLYEGHLESKERFAIQRYLLIIGKKKNMQVLSHTFTYFST